MDMSNLEVHNAGYRYILVVIDSLSPYLFTEKLKSKSAKAVLAAFENIFSRSPELPHVLNSDKGTEFINKHLQAL